MEYAINEYQVVQNHKQCIWKICVLQMQHTALPLFYVNIWHGKLSSGKATALIHKMLQQDHLLVY